MIKIVILRGGLGNQMFGYAFALQLKRRYLFSWVIIDMFDTYHAHNNLELKKIFKSIRLYNLNFYKLLRKIILVCNKYTLFSRIIEKYSDYGKFNHTYLHTNHKLAIYDGFWQSEKYFESNKKIIKKKFKFDINQLNSKSIEYLKLIQENNSASIHIRRGDYLNHEISFGGVCTIEYYLKAINYLNSRQSKVLYFIFTDDIKWVTENYNIDNSIIVDCNVGVDSWQDMCLMSNCKHNIIANSTFSWWGAWLNKNKDKLVLAPHKWFSYSNFTDIIPDNWIKI